MYADRINYWKGIFSLPNALFVTGVFIVLAVADSFLLGDMYRELSKKICGNAEQLRWTIAVVVNLIAALCSHELSRSRAAGAFFDWEVANFDAAFPADVAHRRVSKARKSRRFGLFLMLGLFAALLSLILYMRAELMVKTNTVHLSDTWIISMGLCLMAFEILAGCYFLYLLEYLIWALAHGLLQRRVTEGIRSVAKLDRCIFENCMYLHDSVQVTSDMQDALYRFSYRRLDLHYCDPTPEPGHFLPLKSLPPDLNTPKFN